MSRAFYVIGSLLLLPGCLLLEARNFPDAPTDATCLHDAAVEADWEFKRTKDAGDHGEEP